MIPLFTLFLLFAAPARVRVPGRIGGVDVTAIGRLLRGKAVWVVGRDGKRRAFERGGWEHFGRAQKD